jgi:hypothetical protein
MVLIILSLLWYGVTSAYDIKNFWYHSPMISPISLISRHLLGKLVLVGGATGQELRLLLPRCRQRTGDGCPAELRRTWSSAWTCCSGCCASSEWWPIYSRRKKSARSGRCCGQCSPCRHSADAPRQMTLVLIVIGWTRCSSWIQVGNWWEVEGGGSEWPSRQPGQFESGVTDDGVARRACKRAEAAPPPICHCTRAKNCDTTSYCAIAKIFNLIQY